MKYRTRKQATEYLRKKGVVLGDNRLAQLALVGRGPEFQYSGRYPLYTEAKLDIWAEAQLLVRALRAGTLPEETVLNPDSLSPPTTKARSYTPETSADHAA